MLFDGMIGRGKVSRNADNKERGALTHSERPTVSHIPYISIIVPVYNSEAYLPDLFSSLENQTFEDYEVIFVDDGSTDRTSRFRVLFRGFRGSRVIHQENAGGASARNRGIDHAKGELMICIDSDDTLSPVLLEHMALPSRIQMLHGDFLYRHLLRRHRRVQINALGGKCRSGNQHPLPPCERNRSIPRRHWLHREQNDTEINHREA